jgi:serine/threonine-protein kinase RsbW
VEDEGPGFDPATIPDPTEDENLEIPSGRGVMLIKAYMTEVEYVPPGNLLRMTYRKPA